MPTMVSIFMTHLNTITIRVRSKPTVSSLQVLLVRPKLSAGVAVADSNMAHLEGL